MITLLFLAIWVLFALCCGLLLALIGIERHRRSATRRVRHQAERIRSYRAELADKTAELEDKTAENKLLGEALDEVTEANRQLAATAAAASPAAEQPWPRWGYRTLRDICNATSPADFNRKDNR
ncbi:hypothetical protein AB0J68_01370 [Micromonospora sp. NPDC049580]|uniref:hypothetical protein n=1 Tax=Micromonospora sp. NPDC049580 TaxID=3154832 RepID=UPI0034289DA1